MAGIDTVIHLAAVPDDFGPYDGDLMQINIIGLYNVCEAAREAGVQRLVLTSSCQVISGLRLNHELPIVLSDGTAPINHYAAMKVFAETLGGLYARGVQSGA